MFLRFRDWDSGFLGLVAGLGAEGLRVWALGSTPLRKEENFITFAGTTIQMFITFPFFVQFQSFVWFGGCKVWWFQAIRPMEGTAHKSKIFAVRDHM